MTAYEILLKDKIDREEKKREAKKRAQEEKAKAEVKEPNPREDINRAQREYKNELNKLNLERDKRARVIIAKALKECSKDLEKLRIEEMQERATASKVDMLGNYTIERYTKALDFYAVENIIPLLNMFSTVGGRQLYQELIISRVNRPRA